jgi:diguanylate cyclase (GGDEF)-like protein
MFVVFVLQLPYHLSMYMKKRMLRLAIDILLAYLAFLSVLLSVYAIVLYGKNESLEIANRAELALVKQNILQDQNGILEDLDLFARLDESVAVLSGSPDARDRFAYMARMMMDSRPDYDQIRLLGLDGAEIVRVDYHEGNPVAVGDRLLQDKSGRYYYEEARALEPGQVYVSKLDLNAENGEIEIPYKPMIRYLKPVVDPDGKTIGYVVINYLARQMFERLDNASEKLGSDFVLVNDGGYYLHGKPEGMLWGDQIAGHAGENLASASPSFWEMLQENRSGMYESDRSVRFYDLFGLDEGTEESIRSSGQRLLLLEEMDRDTWDSYSQPIRNALALIAIAGLVCIPVLAYLYFRMRETNESLVTQLQEDASIDPLTGIFNRRTGFELLKEEIETANRTESSLSICYIDIDSLKAVNDNLGHDAGDLYLLSLVDILDRFPVTRQHVVRLGGDEFLVMLPACSFDEAEALLGKANQLLRTREEEQQSPIPWSFSFGTVEVTHLDFPKAQ